MITEPIWVVIISASVSFGTALATTLLTPWVQSRVEKSKIRTTTTYPKAFEAVAHLNTALVEAYEAVELFDATNLARRATLEAFDEASAAAEHVGKALLRARMYLTETQELAVMTAENIFLEASTIIGGASTFNRTNSQFQAQVDVSQGAEEQVPIEQPNMNDETKVLFERWKARVERFDWGQVQIKFDAAVAALAPLLRP